MWLGFGGAPRWDRNMPQPLRRQRGAASAKPPGFHRVSRDSAGLNVADPGDPTDATCDSERAESGGVVIGEYEGCRAMVTGGEAFRSASRQALWNGQVGG